MNRIVGIALMAAAVTGSAAAMADVDPRKEGVVGGVAVVLDAKDAAQLVALQSRGQFLVHGLVREAPEAEGLQKDLAAAGKSGPVTVGLWDGARIPMVAGTVNVVVADQITDEIRRVLAPYGIAMAPNGSKLWEKPWPKGMDEWTHALHDPTNNAVGDDDTVGSPRRIKWQAGPKMLRHHDHLPSLSAMATSRGKLFYIFDEAPSLSVLLPPRWHLIARDAFNGVFLWKKPIAEWHPHLWPLKSMPATLPRRLVSVGDQVFVTLGIRAPVSQLSAADGSVKRVFQDTEKCEEIIVSGRTLLAVCLRGKGPLDDTDKPHESFLDGRVTKFPLAKKLASGITSPQWLHADRRIIAYDVESGAKRWHYDGKVAAHTLATDGKRVYFHDAEAVVAIGFDDGKRQWRSDPVPVWKEYHGWFGASLVVYDGVVLFAGGENMTWQSAGTPKGANDTMTALSADDGRKLWTAPHPATGYRSPEDLMVAQGLVWAGDYTHKGSAPFKGYDPKTGKLVKEYNVDFGHGFHYRCHPSRATRKYLIASKVGTNLVSFEREFVENNQWIRGACGFGMLPANGVLYATPDPCNCFPESKLNGFAAVATVEHVGKRVDASPKRVKGPAFKADGGWKLTPAGPDEWPTYRHDAARSGTIDSDINPKLTRAWKTKVAAKISAPVIAGGRVYVACIDEHTVAALSLETGKPLWRATAGGRVDSPPTVVGELIFFGAADGTVSCVTAADGRLVWRTRVAPADDRLVSNDRLESVWPVHGSVLYHNKLIYAVAGRSKFVDGGLHFVALDPATGEVKVQENNSLEGSPTKGMDTEPALTDVLAGKGGNIFMRSMAYDLTCKPASGGPRHLFASNSFIDGSWFHRSFWVYGTDFAGGCGGFGKTGNSNISGRIMVEDDAKVYAFGRQRYGWGSAFDYKLYMTDTASKPAPPPAPKAAKGKKKKRPRGSGGKPKPTWSVESGILVRGMLKARDRLFLAGPPKLYNEQEAILQLEDPKIAAKVANQARELEDSGLILVLSAKDGAEVGRIDLDGAVAWDGLAAGGGGLVLSMRDGTVQRFGPAGR